MLSEQSKKAIENIMINDIIINHIEDNDFIVELVSKKCHKEILYNQFKQDTKQSNSIYQIVSFAKIVIRNETNGFAKLDRIYLPTDIYNKLKSQSEGKNFTIYGVKVLETTHRKCEWIAAIAKCDEISNRSLGYKVVIDGEIEI
ncbi:MAG: hypothetical protein BAJALOKI3v1_50084 [Promethearchaeota archaeon]|nr:MAG: hypothetical protein BAJALOKI3v1_50084 [Candidatus Lokiarchaeota archaeon]